MPTVHIPKTSELPPDKRSALEGIAKRRRQAPDDISLVVRSLVHWPDYLRQRDYEARYGFRAMGEIPQLTKESIHVAISMVNNCGY